MKRTLLFIAFLILSLNANAQYVNVWKDGKLTFETKQKIDTEGYEDETDYDGENEVLGINMEIINYEDELVEYLRDVKFSSRQGCINMDMEITKDGRSFLTNYKSHFTVCHDKDDEGYVLNAVIFRDDNQKVYDIALYCYEISIEEGIKVLESFKFLD